MYDTKGELFFEDARKIVPEELPDIDLICGGFPCQSFSIAGKRGGFEDARGTLFFEIARIARVPGSTYGVDVPHHLRVKISTAVSKEKAKKPCHLFRLRAKFAAIKS